MGVDYNNHCYISYNFSGCKYGYYGLWYGKSCREVYTIISYILFQMKRDGVCDLNEEDEIIKDKSGNDWWWGHSYNFEKGKNEVVANSRHFLLAYAAILKEFRKEAKRCFRDGCDCFDGDAPKNIKNPWNKIRKNYAAMKIQRFYRSLKK
jgi:hypothetical protein